MAKSKLMHFNEILIHSSDDAPADPEDSFQKFCDKIKAIVSQNTIITEAHGGPVKVIEIGPREKLESTFELRGEIGNGIVTLQFKLRYIKDSKSFDIGYEADLTIEGGQIMKMVLKSTESNLRILLRTPIINAFNNSFTESVKLGKVKTIKLNRNEQYLEKVLYPEGKSLSKWEKKSADAIKKAEEKLKPPEMEGKKCYIHSDVLALRYCDWCKKPICEKDVILPLKGQIVYTDKKHRNPPTFVCPNCIEPVMKEWGPKSKFQVKAYRRAHK